MEKKPVTAPVFQLRCPVHGWRVAADGEGRLIGLCPGCAGEAADAMKIIAGAAA